VEREEVSALPEGVVMATMDPVVEMALLKRYTLFIFPVAVGPPIGSSSLTSL